MGDLQKRPVSRESEVIQEKMPQWICKNWAVQIVSKLFDNECSLILRQDGEPFVKEHFQRTWAVNFFKVIIRQVFQVKEKFIPRLVLNSCLKYISKAVKFSPTFRLFDKNSISHLIVNVILPILYREKSDEELWKNNPIEFIHEMEMLNLIIRSQKSQAIAILRRISSKVSLMNFFKFITIEIQQPIDVIRKEAIMLALGYFKKNKKDSTIKDHIESILTDFVYCELTSQIGFMRYRAVWVYNRFSYPYSQSPNFKALGLKELSKLLLDSELLVRYESSLALPKFLNVGTPNCGLDLALKTVLGVYLNLWNEIHSNDVMKALTKIISAFGEEIIPFTVELALNLSRDFNCIIEQDSTQSDIYLEYHLYIIRMLISISMESSGHEILMKISYIVNPIFNYCLSKRRSYCCVYVYFREAISLLSSILYYTPDNFMPHLYYLMKIIDTSILGYCAKIPDALRYIDSSLAAIVNFIAKYKGQTLENLLCILEMVFRLLKGESREAIFGCKILISILENYKFALDSYLLGILSIISEAFTVDSSELNIYCSEAINVALWNSTLLALSAEPLISSALQFSFKHLGSYDNSIARSHMIYGFGSLFLIIPQLSQHITSTLPVAFRAILQLYFVQKYEYYSSEERSYESQEDAGILYDSPFKNIDQEKFIKDITLNLYENYPEIMDSILKLLNKTEAAFLNFLKN